MVHFSTNFNTEKVLLLEWVDHVPKLSKTVARKFQSGQNIGKWPRPCPYSDKILSREPNDLESSFSHQNVRNRPICNLLKRIFPMMYTLISIIPETDLAFSSNLAKCVF